MFRTERIQTLACNNMAYCTSAKKNFKISDIICDKNIFEQIF